MARARSTTDEAVMALLASAATPLSAYQLLGALRDRGVQSPPVVYRALERLEKAGQIHRIEQLNAYVACPGDHEGHSVVLAVCTCCKRVEEWPAGDVDRLLATKAGRAGFRLAPRTIEVAGLCAECSGAEAPGETVACCGGGAHAHDHPHDHAHDHDHAHPHDHGASGRRTRPEG